MQITPAWVQDGSGSRWNRKTSDLLISLPWPCHDGEMKVHSSKHNQFGSNKASKLWYRAAQKGVNLQEAISTPVLEKRYVYLYTHKVQGIPLHSQEPSISTKPPTALAQKRLQHDTEWEIQDNQGLRETCQLNFLLQNLEDESFKHGQHRKRKEDILISSSYSYEIEKAVIKFGICTMKTVLLALAV